MAIYNIHSCGHHSVSDPWKSGPDEPVSSLCIDCRRSRIGETIEFIRHGKPPASGASINHRDRTAEEGVSVYEIANGKPQYVGWYFGISERPAYKGKGVITGWGADGEPLVRIISIRKTAKT